MPCLCQASHYHNRNCEACVVIRRLSFTEVKVLLKVTKEVKSSQDLKPTLFSDSL